MGKDKQKREKKKPKKESCWPVGGYRIQGRCEGGNDPVTS